MTSMYSEASPKTLMDAFQRIRTKLEGQHAQAAIEHIECGELKERLVMRGLLRQSPAGMYPQQHEQIVFGQRATASILTAQRKPVAGTYNQWNPWNLQNTSN